MKSILLLVVLYCIPFIAMESPQNILNQQLVNAVIKRDVAMVHSLLEQGADPGYDPQLLCNILDTFKGGSPEFTNATYELIDILIKHPKTNINCVGAKDLTPLMHALQSRQNRLIDKLASTGRLNFNVRNSKGKSALDFTTNKSMRQWLIQHGAGSSLGGTKVPVAPEPTNTVPAAATGQKRKEPWQAFVGQSMQVTPQKRSASEPKDFIRAIVDAIISKDIDGALNYLNAWQGQFDINKQGPTGQTILSLAIQRNLLPVVQRLVLIPELQINYKDSQGRTLLMHALKTENIPIVSALLGRPDILINEVDNNGDTVLDYFFKFPRSNNSIAIARLLRSRGAKTGLELRTGSDPRLSKEDTTQFPSEIYSKLGLTQAATPYEILGVNKDASEADIRTAFKKKAFQWHPDKNSDPAAKEVIQLINWAYTQIGPK